MAEATQPPLPDIKYSLYEIAHYTRYAIEIAELAGIFGVELTDDFRGLAETAR